MALNLTQFPISVLQMWGTYLSCSLIYASASFLKGLRLLEPDGSAGVQVFTPHEGSANHDMGYDLCDKRQQEMVFKMLGNVMELINRLPKALASLDYPLIKLISANK